MLFLCRSLQRLETGVRKATYEKYRWLIDVVDDLAMESLSKQNLDAQNLLREEMSHLERSLSVFVFRVL